MAYFQDPNLINTKAFIAYAHNPGQYEEVQPPDVQAALQSNPGLTIERLEEMYHQEVKEHGDRQEQMIRDHMMTINRFANFLLTKGVSIEYDQNITDTGSGNLRRWFQERIGASEYVILIVTPSLLNFLTGDVPPEKEMLFVGDYFYNLIEGRSKPILPVFLNRPKDVSLLPVSLEMSDKYQIDEPFDISYERNDDLERLYALLTGQNRFVAPCPPTSGIVPITKKRGRVGGGVQQRMTGVPARPQHRNLLDTLLKIQAPLTDLQITLIADKSDFSSQWKMLASCLNLSRSQIEMCEVNSGGYNNSEKCLQMLKLWRDSGANSVAHLAHVLYDVLRNMTMLEILHNSVCM